MVYSFRSIQNKIIFWALLPCFLVIGAFTLVALLTIKNTALNVVTQRDVVLAEFAGKRLSENIRPYPLFLQKLATQQAVQKRDYRQLEALFESSNNWLHLFDEGLALYDEQGALLWTSGKDIPLSAAQYPVQADFKRIKTTLRPLFSNILFQNSWDNGVVLVTVPIMGEEGTFDGALTGICSVKYSTIGATYTRVLEYEAGKSSYAYLVDGEGTVLYHRHSSLIGSKIDEREIVRTVIQGNSGAMMTNNRAGERVISGYAPVPGTNWGVVTQGDWSSIKDLIELYNRFFQLVLWGGCLMIVLFVFFFIQKLLRPIQHLTRGAAQVSRGNLVEIPVDKTSDELEMLSKQFNSMIRAMKSAFAANAERIEELDKARLELSRSEEKIRSIINSVTDIMFLVERSGLIVWVNERGKQIFGAKAEGSKYTHVFYQQDEAPEDCFIQEFFSGSLDTDIELKIWNEEKYSDYWCSANVVQSAPDGEVLKIVVVCRNITEKNGSRLRYKKMPSWQRLVNWLPVWPTRLTTPSPASLTTPKSSTTAGTRKIPNMASCRNGSSRRVSASQGSFPSSFPLPEAI